MTPSHPVVSLFVGLSRCTTPFSRSFIVPLSALGVWFTGCEIQARPNDVTGDERRRGQRRENKKQRLGKTWGWKCGGCWRDFVRWKMDSMPKYCVIHQNLSDVSGISSRLVQKYISPELIKHFLKTRQNFLLHHNFFLFH